MKTPPRKIEVGRIEGVEETVHFTPEEYELFLKKVRELQPTICRACGVNALYPTFEENPQYRCSECGHDYDGLMP